MENGLGTPVEPPKATRPHASKACNECKQQKLKCNARLDYPNPCARCKKLGLGCAIENGFKRINKRQKSTILQRENELLREQLNSTYGNHHARNHASPSDRVGSSSSPSSMSRPESFHDLGLPQPAFNAPHTELATASPSKETLPRSLADNVLEPKEIEEIFAIYFAQYAKHLPFLDSTVPPNSYYDQSPLLFWAIISAGSRRYMKNSTLLGSIAEHVLKLGWSSMHISGSVIPNIQGLLILSTWPFPTNTTSKDNTFTLSGMGVMLAIQIGLHVPLQGQEYSRTRIDLSNEGIARRVQLWSYCVVVHQKAACALGYPITLPLDPFQRKLDVNGLMRLAPQSLHLEVRTASIIGRINSVFSEFSFDDPHNQAPVAPSMMLSVFETQLNEVGPENAGLTDLEYLYLQISRLQLRIYHLRCPQTEMFPVNLLKLYTTALQIIELVGKLDNETGLASYCPHHIYRMMALAAAVVLRVLKTPLSAHISDDRSGRPTFLLAISLLKKMSVYNNDMPGRMAGIFSQLWTSEKAFKSEGVGDSSTALRIQSRLSMSLLHDTMWWWREEFAGQHVVDPKPSNPKSKDQNANQSESNAAPNSGVNVDGHQIETNTSAVTTNINPNSDSMADLDLTGQANPLDSLFTTDDSMSFLWDPVDHGFESMIELYPDSWPL